MNKKEMVYIIKRADQFSKWAEEQRKEAAQAKTPEDREYIRLQARLNECAANTLSNLLTELNTKAKA